MKKKSVFDKILKKDNYTKDEVKEILMKTYEGFTAGFIKKHPKAIYQAKKEVIDDVEDLVRTLAGDFGETPIYKDFQKLKKRHLSTFPKKEKETNSSSKKDCLCLLHPCKYRIKFKCKYPTTRI